ncbi:MAG: BTAD domain-containing putative transcriptional regulator [Caldilineaceae bacterium]
MAGLNLRFFGQFQVTRAERPITAFESDKGRALLTYLAVEAAQAHSRTALTALLWPDYTETSARGSLRQALYQLRQIIGDEESTPAFLLITRQTLQFNPDAPYQCDVTAFGDCLQHCASHVHAQLAQCPTCLAQLRQAVELYQGEFLAGFAIADSAGFEEWRRGKQEQFHLQVLDALTILADADEVAGAWEQAQQSARRQLTLEPWREEAHRQLMRLLVRQGQRAAAVAQYHTCRQILQTELGVEPSAATNHLYEQIRAGLFAQPAEPLVVHASQPPVAQPVAQPNAAPTAPVSADSSRPRHNLPTRLTPFVGRVREVVEIMAYLQQPDHRLLTLVGPGGMGKTRLAIEVARTLLDHYADGVFFISLAPLTSTAALAPAIVSALELDLPGANLEKSLLHFLRSKQMLLILDNVEHLPDAVSTVITLVEGAPGVQIIVTSRARLNLQGEQLYSVQPLSFQSAPSLEAGLATDAVRLFSQCAQRVNPAFSIDATTLPAILRICQLVEGMPLGLEMAAGWVVLLSLAEIAAEIERSVDFLTVEWANAPDRQRSMRAVFEWSWRLLTDAEQQVFRQLALFRGGFTGKAAEQVAGASLRVLAALVHKSLVRRVEQSAGQGGTRYEIHELLRQFAAEHLVHNPAEYEQVVARHSTFYLAYVAAQETRLARHEPREAAAEIQVEIDNIRQAWRYALQRRDLPALHRSAWALHSFYRLTGSAAEALHAFQLIAEHFPALTAPALLRDLSPQQNPAPVSRLVAIHAYLLALQNKVDQAIVVAQCGLTWAEAEKATDAAALSHFSWGQALRLQGQLGDAQFHFEQALHLAGLGTTATAKSELLYDVECFVELWLGGLAADRGFYHQARVQMERSLHLAQNLGKRRLAMTALINMADIARRMGAYSSARQEYEDALQLARAVGFRWGEGISQLELGEVARLQGEYSYAAALIEGTLPILQEIGEHRNALALIWLGRLYAYMGDTTAADAWLARSQQFSEQAQGWEPAIEHSQARMVLALHQGEPQQALTYASQCWQSGQTHGLPGQQAYALIGMGSAQRQLGQLTAAKSAYEQAFALYTAIGRPDMAVEALAGLAALAQQQGDQQQALSLVETVLKQLAEHPNSGQDEPFFLYLTCYQVLAAAQDPRAPTILQQGYRLLQRYADQITEDRLRHSFLQNVLVHRALQQAYADFQASAPAALPSRDNGQPDRANLVGMTTGKVAR